MNLSSRIVSAVAYSVCQDLAGAAEPRLGAPYNDVARFLDEQIGPLAGTEVAVRLRKMGRLGDAPIFLFHQAPDVRVVLSAKAAGVNHVLKVPVDFDGDLKDLLDRTLGLIKREGPN